MKNLQNVLHFVIILVIDLTDGREKMAVFDEQQGFIGHVKFLVKDMQGQVVVIIIPVLVMVCQPVIFSENSEQGHEIIATRQIQLGYISAPPAEIEVNIIS